jgi:hypothetical protein
MKCFYKQFLSDLSSIQLLGSPGRTFLIYTVATCGTLIMLVRSLWLEVSLLFAAAGGGGGCVGSENGLFPVL